MPEAALIMTEIIRIGNTWGAKTTFYGLSGLGDLLTAPQQPFGRNYQVGYQLNKGKKL